MDRVGPSTALLTPLCMLLTGLVVALSPTPGHGQDAPVSPTGPCATPRQAVLTFEAHVAGPDKDLERAARCFDFSTWEASRERQLRVLTQLKMVLDGRGIVIQPTLLPDEAAYTNEETGLPEYDLLGARLEGVALHRVEGEWRFTPSSAQQIQVLFDATFPFGLRRLASHLPLWMHTTVAGVKVWKLAGLLLIVLLSWVLALVLHGILVQAFLRVAAQARFSWASEAVRLSRRWVRLLIAAGLVAPLVPELLLPVQLSLVVMIAVQAVVATSVVMLVWRLIDVLCGFLAIKAGETRTRLDDQLVPLVRKVLKFVLVLLAALFILQNLNVNIGSLLAGLGLGGLAIALAAKDTLANMFGSLMIFTDRPFQIGDWVALNGIEGTVEEVGFRSTRIRTFYKSLVTVPNSTVASATIDNLGERTFRRLKMTLGLTYSTTPDQIEAYVEGLRAILQDNPAVVRDAYEVHFHGFGESSLNVLIYCFLDVPNWSEELQQRQALFLQFMRLAEALGVSFAFPTQSLHIESHRQGAASHTSPTREELAAIVHSFARGGERDLAHLPGRLTDGYEASSRGEGAAEEDS